VLLIKINDVYKNSLLVKEGKFSFVFDRAFPKLESIIDKISTKVEITSDLDNIYRIGFLYLFSQFFGSIEIIKKEFGFLKFATNEETKKLSFGLQQTIAVLFSGRLRERIAIYKPNGEPLRYSGIITENTQTLIGELMLTEKDKSKTISLNEFCEKIATDKEFRTCLHPLIQFFDDLKVVENLKIKDEKNREKYETTKEDDFRWTALIIFACYLRGLVNKIDVINVAKLLPNIEKSLKDENIYLKSNEQLSENIKNFEEAYASSFSLYNELFKKKGKE